MPSDLAAVSTPAMERLDFVLPDFTRVSWVADRAKEVWQPRLQRISRAWLEIEWRSVVAGIRPCGATMVSPEDLVERAGTWLEHGLACLPLEAQAAEGFSYVSTGKPA